MKIISFILFFIFSSTGFSQWAQKEDFPGSSRNNAVSFSIGKKGYYGLGQKQTDVYKYKVYDDIWEYDPDMDYWTQKASIPGGGKLGIKGFAVNGKGYAGGGYFISAYGPNAGGNDYQPDFYQFNPDSDKWTKKNNHFLGEKDICFVINDTLHSVNIEYKVMETYNPVTDTWIEKKWDKKANAPYYMDIAGINFYFGIGRKEYIITTTRKKKNCINTLWEFDPSTIIWKRKGDLPSPGNDTLCAFALGEKGYVLRGKDNFLEYNISPNSRNAVGKEIMLPEKYFTPVFVIDERIYFFCQHEFWEFWPEK